MDKSLIVNREAAWHAEILKEDINAGFYDDSDEELTQKEIKLKKKKDYQRKYYLAHKQAILQKRKAARDCSHNAASKKTFNKSIAI